MNEPEHRDELVDHHVDYNTLTPPATSPRTRSLLEGSHNQPSRSLSSEFPSPSVPPQHGSETLITASVDRGLRKSIVIVITVTLAMIINIANSSSMSIAMPTVQRELNLKPAQLQWIVSAYPLSSGCLLLVFGRLADLYGRKKMFLAGTAFLATFTLACGFAKDIVTLDILRGMQGIGAAATIPASLGILAHAFPPSRARSWAFSTFSAGAPIGSVFGTTIGGVMTEFTAHKWRSSFYLLTGINVLCIIGAWFAVDKDAPSEEPDRRTDFIGSLLVTAGLILIVFVLSQGEVASQKWKTPYIIALLILGILLLGVFVYWQYHLEQVQNDPNAPYSVLTPPPLLKVTIWTRANGRFAAMMVITFTNCCAFLGWAFWVQLYYQNYIGLSPMQTVVRLLPVPVSGVLCNVFIGSTAARVPLVWIVTGGSCATMLASLLFALIIPSASYWAFAFPASCLSAIGGDLVFAAGTLFIAKFSLPHEQSVSGALFNTMAQVGVAVGITVSTVVFDAVSAKTPGDVDQITPYRAAQWTCVGFGAIATILSVSFFRGVGVVGDRKTKLSPSCAPETEKDLQEQEVAPNQDLFTKSSLDEKGSSPV